MKSTLIRGGYSLDDHTGVWSRDDYCGIHYTDGDEAEHRIAKIVETASDLTVLSEELREYCADWPSLYHLSGSRANILRPFERHLDGDVLEIGAGCGAITRYLGECGGNVLALEGSRRRASIARARTRDLAGVNVVAERFDDFRCDRKFDVVTLVGVLEYASMFSDSHEPTLEMLRRARSFLRPDGVLIIAIENQLGLKYFAGALEDHVGRAMYGIENRYRNDQPQTFGRKELSNIIAKAGYRKTCFLAPFPDYKLPISIITETGLVSSDFDAASLASQSVPYDPQLPQILAFSPELVWPTIAQNGIALDLANSFVIAAHNSDSAVVDQSCLAWHYSTSRQKSFCKESRFIRNADGRIEVQYRPMGTPDTMTLVNSGPLNFQVPERSDYVHGHPLSREIIEILSRDGWTFDEVKRFFRKYIQILESLLTKSKPDEAGEKIDTPDRVLPGFFFDIAPHNIIESRDGEYHVIDKEWDLTAGVSAGFLMFRSLLNIISFTTKVGHSYEEFEPTPIGLIRSIMESIGWRVTYETIVRYAEHEAAIQVIVRGGSSKLLGTLNWLNSGVLIRHNLCQRVEADTHAIALLDSKIAEHERKITELTSTIAMRDRSIAELRYSTSWKITAPLRFVGRSTRQMHKALQLLPDAVAHSGGMGSAAQKAYHILRREGFVGLRSRLRFLAATRQTVGDISLEADQPDGNDWHIVPYYVDPRLDAQPPQCPKGISVAVHLHLVYDHMLQEMVERLAKVPCSFDLYVSVPEGRDLDDTARHLQECLPRVGQIAVERVPNRGRAFAPLIVQFGKRLSEYNIVGHFSAKRHNKSLSAWSDDVLDHLLGTAQSSGGRIAHFFELLQTRSKLIYPEGRTGFPKEKSGWGDNYDIARDTLKRHTHLSIETFPNVEFPEGAMFWARGACLREFLNLPLSFDDFPEEPLPPDGTLAHALERLILIFARDYEGDFLRLHHGDSIQDYRDYEEQQDFSGSIIHNDIKVLAYYLPQFHPIAENDEWHGKGFTEWTKVRAANPLFEGHYQQHIPHQDIGYYLLDSPDTLRMQANLMRFAGVQGMVFYHYWFGGRMILEHPARMLLDTPDIAMPYCFCWANENWTRRWDGNESEILLAQNYSPDDARAFIRYLIPFFQDPRHLQIEGRPLLFVYRPSSIPDIELYVDIWAQECHAAGLLAPYLVAVLTRGATHPHTFGMDAGAERVLHDWTAGGAPEIKKKLASYVPINGSVLSYDDVADFYSSQSDRKDFTYFRSIVPIWDNTARYGKEAYVVHGSTPKRFQEWLESAIAYSKQNLASDRRIVLVNAWNEWAEGAHLEPDTRNGYAYLNAVGRALSNLPYSSQINSGSREIDRTRIHLTFSPLFRKQLAADPGVAQRFLHVLTKSSIFTRCVVTFDPELDCQLTLPIATGTSDQAQLVLEFRTLAFFGPFAIEKMVQTALMYREAAIVSNAHQGDWPVVPITANGSIKSADAYLAPLVLYPANMPELGFKNFRMRTDAQSFVAAPNTEAPDELPVVTTIIRVHKAADFELLRNALCCLVAMRNCICIPLIAAQDLSEEQTRALTALLDDLPWYPGKAPKVDHYRSVDGRGDLRSKMLNESLRKVETRYAGFLDYDDLLMPNAYEFLIGRLRTTGKAVSFGRVFSTAFSNATGLRLKRSRMYEYGSTYEEFVNLNHAPLHSFLLDMSRVDLTGVTYHDDQRYMEDYFLTLQIFTKDNCDWDSLGLNVYIGEYIHSVDRTHTLAFASDTERQAMLSNVEYMRCEDRINELRLLLAKRQVAA